LGSGLGFGLWSGLGLGLLLLPVAHCLGVCDGIEG